MITYRWRVYKRLTITGPVWRAERTHDRLGADFYAEQDGRPRGPSRVPEHAHLTTAHERALAYAIRGAGLDRPRSMR